ncbi:MAG TPA: Ger(x)C family spore germination protein [Paenibacillus sp.]|uniref:Ger(x)C family spore germination protein n=1 Tax=Paenibacillus sp. TaxID=58172 RepID=UPI0028D459F2|nr:Ger(x)C family spore germination protein [Paenibacillus sp.]HUC93070.1 Ger(x)C family spore germination protein [Paenibacillus sp.]
MGIAKRSNRVKLLCFFLMAVPLLAGCWDRIEIEERAVILGISIDKEEEETVKEEANVSHLPGKIPVPQEGMIRLTAQFAVPGRIPLGPGEGGGGSGGGAEQRTVWTLHAVGHTLDDAVSNLQQQISAPLFFGHLRIIVVSEAMAKSGLQNVNDYLRRNPEVRRMSWMAVSKGKAAAFMEAAPEMERVPALYLIATLDQAVKMGKFPLDFVGLYWSNTSKKGQEGFLPYVDIKKSDNVEISGMAYFKGNKMVGKTQPFEIVAYMGIKGVNPAGYQNFVEMPGDSNMVVFTATHRKSKIDVDIKNGRPRMAVKIFLEGNLREKLNESSVIDIGKLKPIEEGTEKGLLKLYRDMIEKTQEKGSDIFGFGEYVRAKEPGYWNKEIKTKEKWQDMYRDVSVDVSVKVSIRRIGTKAR